MYARRVGEAIDFGVHARDVAVLGPLFGLVNRLSPS